MLAGTANGFGLLALAGLLGENAGASELKPHFAPKAKNVIFCFMDGGVSHVDSFDPKPKLAELDGKPFTGSKNPTADVNRKWLKSPWKFRRHGESGMPVSELFPHIAGVRRRPGGHPLDEGRPAAPLDGRAVPAHRARTTPAGRASARG